MITIRQRIVELIGLHGSLRAVARRLQIDVGYLSRLEHGEKDQPSDDVLAKLGLCRIVGYERTESAIQTSATAGAEALRPDETPQGEVSR